MGFELTIEPLGRTISVAEGQRILDACLRAGVYLPHACGHGLCATCKIQVQDGEVEHGEASNFALMDYEREQGKCLACCATIQSDVTIEADIDVDIDARNISVRDYSGTVVRLADLTPTIKGVWIKLDGGDVMDFQAGQYVNLDLPNGIGSRAFSIASSPNTGDEIELNIRLVHGGKATTWIHNELSVGDRIVFSGPYGRFFVRKSAAVPMLFLAAGSGLSSPRSMILDLVESGETLPITLVYGARTLEELYYHQEFLELAERCSWFTYIPALSSESNGTEWTGFRGYVNEAAKEHFGNDFRGQKAYLCGPPVMIEACIAILMQGRLFEKDIYTEKFISAGDAAKARSPLFKNI